MGRMTIYHALGTVVASTLTFAALGTSIGYALGAYAPGYYRTVFRAGREQDFAPTEVGLGLGATQGATGGVVVGLLLVVLFLWRDSRVRRLTPRTASIDQSSLG